MRHSLNQAWQRRDNLGPLQRGDIGRESGRSVIRRLDIVMLVTVPVGSNMMIAVGAKPIQLEQLRRVLDTQLATLPLAG